MKQDYILQLADNVLILGQRLAEWCGHGPVLEEDIALTNTSLDYIGQAANLYRYAGTIEGLGRDEDQLAFLRDAPDYHNVLLAELPNGDYAFTVARQFLFSAWYYLFLDQLKNSTDEFLAGFAEKSIKEVRYHLQHSADWMKRLGDGTAESHERMQKAIDAIWEYTGELFTPSQHDNEGSEAGFAPDIAALREPWLEMVTGVLAESTLKLPADGYMQLGGKAGRHTEHLGFILADMQFLQRAYPNSKW
jgi:ring-1,2-phenylacetyl-CoA epoxidase subunit PaaC